MKNNTFEYGPIILDSRRGVYVYVKVNCPQSVADAVAEGDDNSLLDYHPEYGFTVKREYFVSANLSIGSVDVQISYETYSSMVKDSNNFGW